MFAETAVRVLPFPAVLAMGGVGVRAVVFPRLRDDTMYGRIESKSPS